MVIVKIDPRFAMAHLGFIPNFLQDDDTRPMREQINERYSYGGGWHSIPNFELTGLVLQYPGDPPLLPLAMIKLANGRDECAYFYPHSILAIVQKDGSFDVARLD